MDAISILGKKRVAVSSYRVEVYGVQKDEHPKPYTSIIVDHVVQGTSIDDASVARAVELSARKYCAVGATIAQGETTIEHRTRIIDENGERTCECLVIGPHGKGLAGAEAPTASVSAA